MIDARLRVTCLAALLSLLAACEGGKSGDHKPTGTPTDPVDECESSGQVCRMDHSRLGVCVAQKSTAPECDGRFPCLMCASQH